MFVFFISIPLICVFAAMIFDFLYLIWMPYALPTMCVGGSSNFCKNISLNRYILFFYIHSIYQFHVCIYKKNIVPPNHAAWSREPPQTHHSSRPQGDAWASQKWMPKTQRLLDGPGPQIHQLKGVKAALLECSENPLLAILEIVLSPLIRKKIERDLQKK